MNLRLNKIETDLSRKLKEETKDDKVHSKNYLNNIKNNKKKSYTKNSEVPLKDNKKKYLTIDGELSLSEKLEVKAEKTEKEIPKGIFLDRVK